MKSSSVALLILTLVSLTNGARLNAPGDTISKVVSMLETMLDKSKQDGDKDREMYAKYLCYCNTQKETKTKEIEELATDIALLSNEIERLLAANGELSTEVAKLKDDVAEKERQIAEADKLQGDRQTAWDALEQDLSQSIASMKEAIKVLAEVGADQTVSVGADHTQYMAGFTGFAQVGSQVKNALVAAQAFLPEKDSGAVQSLLQKPFTGTYTSQSGEVMGILKNMRDTFEANYATAETEFKAQTAAHKALRKKLVDAKTEMETMLKKKNGELGDNDSSLATARDAFATAEKTKKAKEDFLEELIPICEKKAKEFEERNALRANEDAAITQAIAILNKDSSFHAFQKVDATSFIQTSRRGSVKVRQSQAIAKAANQATQMLLATPSKSIRLTKIAALIAANNPFEVVMAEIKKMIAVIDKEEKTDKETLDWCNTERAEGAKTIKEKNAQIVALNNEINTLDNKINAPDTGLKAMIDKTEQSLVENDKNQKTETEDRVEENQLYQQNIANQVEAQELVQSAINVLKKYYDEISFAQVSAPEVVEKGPWSGDYKGQSDSGNKVIEMLEYILKEAQKEEEATHSTELSDQHAFEDSMASLKDEQKNLQESLASLKLSLAEAEKDLAEARQNLKKTEAELAAVEKYMLEIKPGCDFITENFQLRGAHRAAEKQGLTSAYGQLKQSAAYTTYEADAHQESLGDCKDICNAEGEDHVKCLACLAKVTVPGYCAGHDNVKGC